MSYLSKNALHKLVLFDKEKNILPNPYYSIPFYDEQGTGKQRLVRKIVKGCMKDKHKFAYIYDNITGEITDFYINGTQQKLKKHQLYYGKDISMLKVWFLIKTKPNTPFIRYSHTYIDALGEEFSYWALVNKYIKGKIRNNIQYAEIYRVKENEKIGRFLIENGRLKGMGIYHIN